MRPAGYLVSTWAFAWPKTLPTSALAGLHLHLSLWSYSGAIPLQEDASPSILHPESLCSGSQLWSGESESGDCL